MKKLEEAASDEEQSVGSCVLWAEHSFLALPFIHFSNLEQLKLLGFIFQQNEEVRLGKLYRSFQ